MKFKLIHSDISSGYRWEFELEAHCVFPRGSTVAYVSGGSGGPIIISLQQIPERIDIENGRGHLTAWLMDADSVDECPFPYKQLDGNASITVFRKDASLTKDQWEAIKPV